MKMKLVSVKAMETAGLRDEFLALPAVEKRECPLCEGFGRDDYDPCQFCETKGYVWVDVSDE